MKFIRLHKRLTALLLFFIVLLTPSARASNLFGSSEMQWEWAGDTDLYAFSTSQLLLSHSACTEANTATVYATPDDLNRLASWTFTIKIPKSKDLSSKNYMTLLLATDEEELETGSPFALKFTATSGSYAVYYGSESASFEMVTEGSYKSQAFTVSFYHVEDVLYFSLSAGEEVVMTSRVEESLASVTLMALAVTYTKTYATKMYYLCDMLLTFGDDVLTSSYSRGEEEEEGEDEEVDDDEEEDAEPYFAGYLWAGDTDLYAFSTSQLLLSHSACTEANTATVYAAPDDLNRLASWTFTIKIPKSKDLSSKNYMTLLLAADEEELETDSPFALKFTATSGNYAVYYGGESASFEMVTEGSYKSQAFTVSFYHVEDVLYFSLSAGEEVVMTSRVEESLASVTLMALAVTYTKTYATKMYYLCDMSLTLGEDVLTSSYSRAEEEEEGEDEEDSKEDSAEESDEEDNDDDSDLVSYFAGYIWEGDTDHYTFTDELLTLAHANCTEASTSSVYATDSRFGSLASLTFTIQIPVKNNLTSNNYITLSVGDFTLKFTGSSGTPSVKYGSSTATYAYDENTTYRYKTFTITFSLKSGRVYFDVTTGDETLISSAVSEDMADVSTITIGNVYTKSYAANCFFVRDMSMTFGDVSFADAVTTATSIDYNAIVINEIMSSSSTSSTDYVELYNNSLNAYDLSELTLYYCSTSATTVKAVSLCDDATMLEPYSYVVLTKDADGLVELYNPADPDAVLAVSSFPGLATNGYVALHDGHDNLVDSVPYRSSWHHSSLSKTTDISLERVSPSGSSTDASNWTSALETADYSTPTEANSVFSTEAIVTTDSTDDDYALEPSATLEGRLFIPQGDGVIAPDHVSILCRASVAESSITVRVFSASGKRIATVYNNQPASSASVTLTWDGTDDSGATLAPGSYILLVTMWGTDGREYTFRRVCTIVGR